MRLNLLSNYIGSIWAVLLQLAFVPLYIRFLGIEQYGLVGFYLTLQATLQILDFGVSPTISREMARYSVQPARADEARDLVRTLEVVYFALGLVIGLGVVIAAPLIATHWIRADVLATSTVQNAVILMGALFALQWPMSFFTGGLMGLQRQVLANGLKITMQTVGGVGAILALWLVSPTIIVFLVWQMVASALGVILTMIVLWKNLPTQGRAARFNFSLLSNVWRFATGVTSIGLMGLVLSQMDKLILSAIVDLKVFGYYVLAGVVASGLAAISGPVINTFFPRFSALIAEGSVETLRQLYYHSFQFLAVILWPAMAFLSLFSFEILWVWTRNAEIAHNVAPIVTILAIGTALNGMTAPPYALHLAYGRTRPIFFILGIAAIIMLPVMIFMTIYYGVIGTAICWAVFNGCYLLVLLQITHRGLLPSAQWRWYLGNLGRPLAGAMVILGLARLLLPAGESLFALLSMLVAIGICALVAAFSVLPQARSWSAQVIWNGIARQK
ncbi:MAG: lipopolysaccharide biosynthesis protein [Thermoleophilia bacterium]